MAFPAMNQDIIHVSIDPVTRRYRVDRKDQAALLRIVSDLQERIRLEMGVNSHGALRFVIPLAMRFTEQAGRVSFRKPKGNNPYNIMGKGVDRPLNKEYEGGREVLRPASFQGYASDAEGVAAFFRALRTAHGGAWKKAWEAIRDVSSIEDFARGLRPHGAPHYLTKPLQDHIAGLRYRARGGLNLLEVIYTDEGTRLRMENAGDEIIFPALIDDPILGPDIAERLKANRLGLEHADNILQRIAFTRARLRL